MTDIHTKT